VGLLAAWSSRRSVAPARRRRSVIITGLVIAAALAGLLVMLVQRVRPSDARLHPGETLFAALEKETGATVHAGNELHLIEDGAVFSAIEREIRAARASVHILVYIWRGEGDPSRGIGEALLARRKGVACRILIDSFGSLKFDDNLEEQLQRSGCEIRRYDRGPMPEPRARNHRKLVVVDGQTAITGGFGIHTSWMGHGRKPQEWRDTAVRAQGPVVASLQRAFEQNWTESDGAALPKSDYPRLQSAGKTPAVFVATSPRPGKASAAEAMYRLIVSSAKKRLWIANSYFIPGDGLQALIIERRKAGVDVRVLTPGPVHDVPPVRAAQRATYKRLLDAGIRIFEYEASMMHAKTIVVDDDVLLIGSTNMDALSFEHLEEGSLVARDPAIAGQMAAHFLEDLKYTKEITRQLWEDRDTVPEVGRRGAGLVSDWL
jgi:cardiolipin synthase